MSSNKRRKPANRPKYYHIWCNIIQRCTNKNHPRYNDYGGRGIFVSDEWRNSYKQFESDMGERPSDNHCVERVDNNLGYCKGNCVWATNVEQARNTRRNHIATYNGVSMTLVEWSKQTGINVNTLYDRANTLKWSDEKVVGTPVRNREKKS